MLVQNTVHHACTASHIRSWYSDIVIHIRNSGIVSLAANYAAHRLNLHNTKAAVVCGNISNHAGGYLDFASLPLCVRHTVTVTNALAAAAIFADNIRADVLELEVPATALHGSLCALGPFFLLARLLLGGSGLFVFHLSEAL